MSQKTKEKKEKSSKARVIDKWRLKTWYTVRAPKYFGEIEVGVTPSDDPEKLMGRVMETTLYDISGDFNQIHVKLFFRINDVKGNEAYTEFWGHDFSRDYIRSLVRRGSTRIEGIFNVTTKDGQALRVSAFAFTHNRAKTSQEYEIRKKMYEVIIRKANDLNFSEFIHEAVLGKIGSEIYNDAKKIIPIRKCEIRKIKVIS